MGGSRGTKIVVMGSFGYLVNHEKKIYVEAFKFAGTEPSITTESQLLACFMEYCWCNNLKVEVVADSWFDSQDIQNASDFYKEFDIESLK